MGRPAKIGGTALFGAVVFLIAGELASGTDSRFVAMMAGTIVCIGVTFNLLRGLTSIAGIGFSVFALCTIVISQFAKVLFFEAADKNLESPNLTIAVYFVFYACVMMGCFVFGRLRIDLPKPMEPRSASQTQLQYSISLAVGFLANLSFFYFELRAKYGGQANEAHSLGLAFSSLLLYSLVLAVISRIRETGGRHSFGFQAFIPWAAILLFGVARTSRGQILLPSLTWLFACYTNGYRFRKKHYVAGVALAILFTTVISPFEIYMRGYLTDLELGERIGGTVEGIRTMPAWSIVLQQSQGGAQTGSREEYYDLPGTFVLSRLSAIRADSNMISATSSGFHYGFTALKIDLLHNIPHFLYKNKPDEDSGWYLGRVTGLNPDYVENVELMITAISDSYGAFGWLGVVVVGTIVFPLCFVIYESIFDIRKPWGLVALGGFAFSFNEVSLGGLISVLVRLPVAVVAVSYLLNGIVSTIPVRGDQLLRAGGAPAARAGR